MKKVSLIYIVIFISILSIIGIKDISNYLKINKANSEFQIGNYSGAISDYKNINDKGLSKANNDILNLNKGVSYLKKGQNELSSNHLTGAINDYKESEKYLQNVSTGVNDTEFYKFNSLGDNKYLIGSGYLLQNNEDETINNRTQSLENYQKAINTDAKKDKTNTIKNYDFVKKELEKLKKKNQKESQKQNLEQKQGGDNNTTNSGTQSNQNKDTGSGGQSQNEKEKPGEIAGKKWTNAGQFNGVGNNQSEENKKPTQEELNELKNYSDSLKQFQKNNLQYLQRGTPETNKDTFDRMMNQFSQDPFFNDVLPSSEGKKDW